MKKILFLEQDTRNGQEVINYYQVVGKTWKNYKIGDLFDIKLNLFVNGQVEKQWVLAQVIGIKKNIIKIRVVVC